MKSISNCWRQLRPSPVASACWAALLALAWLVGCSKEPAPTSTVLAKVGDTDILAEDLRREVDWRRKNHKPVGDRKSLLNELILQEALLQRARHAGLESDPEVRREIRKLLMNTLLDRETAGPRETAAVSTEEVQAQYNRNLETYSRPAKARLALLHLQADAKMSKAKRSEIRTRLEEARRQMAAQEPLRGRGPAGQGFGALSVDYSDDQASRYRGGDVGWFNQGQDSRWPRQVLELGFALEKGAMSEVLEAEGGFYVVMKTDGRDAAVTPLEQVEAVLRQSLLVQKRQEVGMAFRKDVLAQIEVTVHEQNLAAMELPEADTAVVKNEMASPPAFPGLENSVGEP